MALWARLANQSRLRLPYVVGALSIAAAGLVATALIEHPVLKIACLCLTVASILSFQATFWAIPSTFLTGRAAGGLAVIVSIGNLGRFTGPFMIGLIKLPVARHLTGNKKSPRLGPPLALCEEIQR